MRTSYSPSYSEASYFDGFHFQHIADYLEHKRLQNIRRKLRSHRAARRRDQHDHRWAA